MDSITTHLLKVHLEYSFIYIYKILSAQSAGTVKYTDFISAVRLSNECPVYIIKPSDGEALVL